MKCCDREMEEEHGFERKGNRVRNSYVCGKCHRQKWGKWEDEE